MRVDLDAFAACMKQQKDRSRQHQQFGSVASMAWLPNVETKFEGYQQMTCSGRLLCLHSDGETKSSIVAGEKAMLVFDCSPFYAESGGQIGDCGHISNEDGKFVVLDTQKQGHIIIHYGEVETGVITVDAHYQLEVDTRREAIKRNHSATHLLHDALIDVLGEHVVQKGSLVEAERLRFDFSHHAPLTTDQIMQIEQHVNHAITQNYEVQTDVMQLEQAKAQGVRRYSTKNTLMRSVCSLWVSLENYVAVHMYNGRATLVRSYWLNKLRSPKGFVESKLLLPVLRLMLCNITDQLQNLATIAESPVDVLGDKLTKMSSVIKTQQKAIDQLYMAQMQYLSQALVKKVETVGQYRVVAHVVDFDQPKLLRVLTQACLATKQVDVIILWMPQGDKMMLSVGVIGDKVKMVSAADAFKSMASVSGAKGGGKADFAQGSLSHNASDFSNIREKCLKNVWTLLQA